MLTTGGWDVHERPRSAADIKTYVESLDGINNAPPWLWDFLDFLEEHEQECNPSYSEVNPGQLSWIQYHLVSGPRNYVAVGDAMMKLNPVYGAFFTPRYGPFKIIRPTFHRT